MMMIKKEEMVMVKEGDDDGEESEVMILQNGIDKIMINKGNYINGDGYCE